MSVTTTSNARLTTARHILQDYNLHHSNLQPSDEEAAPAPPLDKAPASDASNPPGWEDRWRRVPEFRPLRNQLDEMHDSYTNPIEHNFIRTMFGGEFLP
jgi:hypothetical protein